MSLVPDTTLRRFPIVPEIGNENGKKTITDLTHCSRLGLRGGSVSDWCAAQGLPFPSKVNDVETANGLRIARLGTFELLILSEGQALAKELRDFPAGVYDGYREEGWAWFRFEGPGLLEALATCTSVNLIPNRDGTGRVFQTRFADLDAILLVAASPCGAGADLFFDIASHKYLKSVLTERCPEWRFVSDT